MYIVDQTQHLQEMFQVLSCIFILNNKEERYPKQKASQKFLNFFVDCTFIDARLVFVTPTYGTWYIQQGAYL